MPSTNGFDDVIGAARAGDERAWTTIYDGLAPKVLGYLRSSSAPDPEDLLGEIFLHVVRDIGRFSGGESEFRSWVFGIAHHRVLDDARYRSRRARLVLTDDLPETASDAADAGDHGGGNVEDEALERLASGQIMSALEALNDERRTVVLLRLFGGLRLVQIAEIMGKSVGAVKALQRRGLGDLRKALDRTPGTLFDLQGAEEEETVS